MGQNQSILSAIASDSMSGISDQAIHFVINPTIVDRDRSELVSAGSVTFPDQQEWRMVNPVGRKIDKGLVSNHFLLKTDSLMHSYYNYNVQIYRVQRDGKIDTADIASIEDERITTSIVIEIQKKHPEWQENQIVLTYDGKSTIFTTGKLPLDQRNDKDEVCLEDIIELCHQNGSNNLHFFILCIIY